MVQVKSHEPPVERAFAHLRLLNTIHSWLSPVLVLASLIMVGVRGIERGKDELLWIVLGSALSLLALEFVALLAKRRARAIRARLDAGEQFPVDPKRLRDIAISVNMATTSGPASIVTAAHGFGVSPWNPTARSSGSHH